MDTRHIDIRTILPGEYKKVASTNGGEYHGPCPFCGGEDRFMVQPNHRNGGRWKCRQNCQSEKWQDSISFVMEYENINFRDAIQRLGLKGEQRSYKPAVRNTNSTPVHVGGNLDMSRPALSNMDWKQSARRFAEDSYRHLWSRAGAQARDYLAGRGFDLEKLRCFTSVGYNPNYLHMMWGDTEVHLLQGIVLPTVLWETPQHDVVRIQIRPDKQRPGRGKYVQVKGGTDAFHYPYKMKHLYAGCTVVLCEGIFDALSIPSYAPVVPVSLGSTTACQKRRFVIELSRAGRVVVVTDSDVTKDGKRPGDACANWWLKALGDRAVRLRPTAKDVNDMLTGGEDMMGWLRPYFPPYPGVKILNSCTPHHDPVMQVAADLGAHIDRVSNVEF